MGRTASGTWQHPSSRQCHTDLAIQGQTAGGADREGVDPATGSADAEKDGLEGGSKASGRQRDACCARDDEPEGRASRNVDRRSYQDGFRRQAPQPGRKPGHVVVFVGRGVSDGGFWRDSHLPLSRKADERDVDQLALQDVHRGRD
eukprot:2599718-Rhodomonas_salina.1